MDEHDKQAQELADLLQEFATTLKPHQIERMAHILRTKAPGRKATTPTSHLAQFVTQGIGSGCRQVRPHRSKDHL